MKRAALLLFIPLCLLWDHTVSLGQAQQPHTIEKPSKALSSDEYEKAFRSFERGIAVIGFAPESAILSEAEETHIRMFLANLKAGEPLDKLIIAAWSDDKSSGSKSSQPKPVSEKLARERAQAIAAFLEKEGTDRVETHTMGRHPRWLIKAFPLLAMPSGSSRSHQAEAKLLNALLEKGGPGKALILTKYEAPQANM